jgi:hypothetical protein
MVGATRARVYSVDTPRYLELVRGVLNDAGQIGLQIDLSNYSAWPGASPGVSADDGMLTVAWTDLRFSGGKRVEIRPRFRISDLDSRIRYDYELTISDLMIERFFDLSQQWRKSAVLSPAQPYGSDIDVIGSRTPCRGTWPSKDGSDQAWTTHVQRRQQRMEMRHKIGAGDLPLRISLAWALSHFHPDEKREHRRDGRLRLGRSPTQNPSLPA